MASWLPAATGQPVNAAIATRPWLQLGVAVPGEGRGGAKVSKAQRVPHHLAGLSTSALPADEKNSGGRSSKMSEAFLRQGLIAVRREQQRLAARSAARADSSEEEGRPRQLLPLVR